MVVMALSSAIGCSIISYVHSLLSSLPCLVANQGTITMFAPVLVLVFFKTLTTTRAFAPCVCTMQGTIQSPPKKKTDSPVIPDMPPCGMVHPKDAPDRYDAGKYQLEALASYFKNNADMYGERCGDCNKLIVGEKPKKNEIKPTASQPIRVCKCRNHRGKHRCFFCLCTPCFNIGISKNTLEGREGAVKRSTRANANKST